MKLLLVKTSSLGDVVHALPAVTDALKAVPGLTIDWVVEEGFAAIPERHPGVRRVLPVAIRRWRRNWFGSMTGIRAFLGSLRSETYDVILDSQGLLKSALVASAAHGRRHGYDAGSARESLAATFYGSKHAVDPDQHAITRQRLLMAATLGYEVAGDIDFGLTASGSDTVSKEIVLLHGTTWQSKEWPVTSWQALAAMAAADGLKILVPAGNEVERDRAMAILGTHPGEVLMQPGLGELMNRMATAIGVVTVDTGLGHLAPALGRPVVSIFGATDPRLTGITGPGTKTLVSSHLPCIPCRKRHCRYEKPSDSSSIYPPCYAETSPEAVWQALQLLIGSERTRGTRDA